MKESVGILQTVGRFYIISSLMPALLFVFLIAWMFQDVLALSDIWDKDNLVPFMTLVVVLVAFAIWLSFALFCTQGLIRRLFAGHWFPKLLANWLTGRKKDWHCEQVEHLDEPWGDRNHPRWQKMKDFERDKIRQETLKEICRLESVAPLDKNRLRPTRFGNVLCAGDMYAFEKYGMDGELFWPRLAAVLPQECSADLEQLNNELAFVLNSSLLAGILAVICSCAAVMAWLGWGFSAAFTGRYIVVAGISFLVGYFFYSGGVNVAEGRALMIRVAFDLYRHELLAKLEQELPKDLSQEKQTWEVLNEFFIAGDRLGKIAYEYVYQERKGAATEEEE